MEALARVDAGGAQLWTARSGSGLPVMLCSGGPGCCDYLGPVARMLDPVAEVLRFEQRGCGDSQREGPYDIATCVGDLEALRTHFGHERWVVGGHSWGADLALIYALAHPERVRALLYVCGHGPHDDRGWAAAYHETRDTRGELEPEYRIAPNREVNAACTASFRQYIKRPGLWRDIARLDVPTLIVTAERDIRPAWPALQLAAALPRARHVAIAGAEHMVWSTHASELADALRGFLAELENRR